MSFALQRCFAVGLTLRRTVGNVRAFPSVRLQHTESTPVASSAASVPSAPSEPAAERSSPSTTSPTPASPEPLSIPPAEAGRRYAERAEARFAVSQKEAARLASDLQTLALPDSDATLFDRDNLSGNMSRLKADALHRKAWIQRELKHLREMAANMSKKPLRGSVVFGRELALQPDPSLPANKRRAAMTRKLSIAWHRLSESEREAYRARAKEAHYKSVDLLRIEKATYSPTERWWLSRHLSGIITDGSQSTKLYTLADMLKRIHEINENRKDGFLPRLPPIPEVAAQKAQAMAPWRAFLRRWRERHPRPANVKHRPWFVKTSKEASAAWQVERAAEKATKAAERARVEEATYLREQAAREEADARRDARRAADRAELTARREREGPIIVDLAARRKAARADPPVKE